MAPRSPILRSVGLGLAFAAGAISCSKADKPGKAPFQVQPSGAESCPRVTDGRVLGKVQSAAVVEASGVVASRKNPGVLWVHNDSGGKTEVLALTREGRDLGRFHLTDCRCIDWEDLALGRGPDPHRDYLYVSDTGTNNSPRTEVTVYRVPEPQLDAKGKPEERTLSGVEKLGFVYPTGKMYDVEALLIDPMNGDLYQITKGRTGSSIVLHAPAPLKTTSVTPLTRVHELVFPATGERGSDYVTAADISADGKLVLVKTYTEAYLWHRDPKQPLAKAFDKPACRARVRKEKQGEAIGFSPNSRGYFTISEGEHQPVHFFELQPPSKP